MLVRFFPNIRFSNRRDYYLTKDLCSYRHNFCRCEKKAWKKNQAYMGLKSLTSVIPGAALLPNWVNKLTGNRSLNWFVVNPWKDDDEVIHIWKSYIMRIAGWRIYYMKIIAVIDKDLTPNSLGTNDGQISRWGDAEVLNWLVQTHTCTNVIKIAEYILWIWVNNHVQFLEVY